MSKKWYPVTDILSCIECGTCVNFCSHGVYDKSKYPTPIVVNTDGCIDRCHDCGNECPVGAITYVGDDTEWIPPVFREKGGMPDVSPNYGCGCCCGSKR
ncbi:MAG: ferredoxin family protein [Oscillospiraceae bacterium]|nr:ferredoxin family protein [Oscillospiraceae bacterium]